MAPKAAPAKTGSKGPSPGGSKDASKTASKTGSGQPSRRNSKDIADAYPVEKKPVLSEEDQALMKATTEALDKLIEKGKEAANEMQARHGPSAVFPEACLPNTRRPAQFVATCPLLAGGGRVRPAPAESARTAEV